jgi:hypothetical protein
MKHDNAVPHFDKIDTAGIDACFIHGRQHRAYLRLPFTSRKAGKTLCVIGQNPSAADAQNADKTVRYLEELVFRNHHEYSAILVLNLYSRVDTKKSATHDLLNCCCLEHFNALLRKHDDFLLVYGKLKNEGAYRFRERALDVLKALTGKKVFKLGLDTSYPPHPGNPQILYRNFDLKLVDYNFEEANQ